LDFMKQRESSSFGNPFSLWREKGKGSNFR